MKKYDVIVIGTGGGTKLVSPVAQLGKKVAVIEENKLGGTCLNRGCIPSKMLIHPANVAQHISEAEKFDIQGAKVKSVNFKKLTTRINKTVGKDEKGIKEYYNDTDLFDFYHGHATFIKDKVVEVNGKQLTAKKIFIATGARPSIPPIPGLENTPYMTSTQALKNKSQPKSLIVVGGGYIACELGYAYSALGSKVDFVVRSKLLGREDKDIQEEFTRVFTKEQNVHLGYSTKQVQYKNKKFIVTIQDKKGKKKTLKADQLLIATGVTPNTNKLGLENTKIKTNKRGYITVDKYMQTSVKGIYALGDVVGNYMFRHSVNFEGEFLFKTLFKEKKPKPIKYPPVPHAVFTHPEIAGVGKTEQELIESKTPYIKATHAYAKSGMGMARLSDHGFVKVLFHKKTRRLLGAHIIGDEASNMIHQFIYALTFNATDKKLLEMIYIHPALPEIARNAVRSAKKLLDASR